MRIIDCNVVVGRSIVPGSQVIETPQQLISAMDTAKVDSALIWHIAQYDLFAPVGNTLASEFSRQSDRFLPTWAALPPVTDELPIDILLNGMIENGVKVLRLLPAKQHYLVNGISLSPLLEVMVEHNIPLMLSLERGIVWEDVYQLLNDCPKLTVILTDIGVWGQDRYTYPLLAKYPNVYIETSLLSLEAGGLEFGVNKFGAEKFVFGSNFPFKYIEAPLLDLLHSPISDEAKQLIAAGNIERILSEVRL